MQAEKKARLRAKLKRILILGLSFLKIGLFTFGGGYAMIALIQKEFVAKRKWIGNDEFLDMVAIAESTPGPLAINSATYIGYKAGGAWGAAASTLCVCIPSFVIIYLISLFFNAFSHCSHPACRRVRHGTVCHSLVIFLNIFGNFRPCAIARGRFFVVKERRKDESGQGGTVEGRRLTEKRLRMRGSERKQVVQGGVVKGQRGEGMTGRSVIKRRQEGAGQKGTG